MKTLREFKDDLQEAAAKTPHQQMLKTLGFPKSSGEMLRWYGGHGEHKSDWAKKGGYAGGKMIDKVVSKALSSGFKKVTNKEGGNPDGSVITSGSHYAHPDGHRLEVDKRFGSTKADNHYSMHLSHNAK